MSDDATLARARDIAYRHYLHSFEADKHASDYPERMKPETPDDLFAWPEQQVLVEDIAAALQAYGDERERQRAEEDAKIASGFRMPNKQGSKPNIRSAVNQTVDWIAEAIRASGEKEAGG